MSYVAAAAHPKGPGLVVKGLMVMMVMTNIHTYLHTYNVSCSSQDCDLG